MSRQPIGKVKVGDIGKDIFENPVIVTIDTTIKDALKKLIEKHHKSHIYVTNKEGKMIGSVRVNNIIQYIFPYETIWESNSEYLQMGIFSKDGLEDLLTQDFYYVRDSTKISDMIIIMLREKINELPVLDSEMRIIGEVSIFEVINAYLKD